MRQATLCEFEFAQRLITCELVYSNINLLIYETKNDSFSTKSTCLKDDQTKTKSIEKRSTHNVCTTRSFVSLCCFAFGDGLRRFFLWHAPFFNIGSATSSSATRRTSCRTRQPTWSSRCAWRRGDASPRRDKPCSSAFGEPLKLT